MRFYKPGQTQYQSQFAPLNLDFMQKSLAQKEANDAIAEDLLDKTSQLQVEGGMLSDPNEVKKYNDWIQSNTAAIRDKFYSGELDAKEAARNLNKISQFYNTNEDIKFFNADKQLSANTRTRIAQGKANNALSSNISYLDGQLNTTPISSKEGLDALARGHNLLNPTGIYDKENYQHQLDKFVADVVSSEWDSAPKEYKEINGVNMLVTKSGGKTKEQLTRDKILEWGMNVAEQEFRNSNTPFIQYQKDLARKFGYEYTPEQFATDAANAYTGYYTKDITKSDSNYVQVSNNNQKKEPEEQPISYPGMTANLKYGINVNDVLNDPQAFNWMSKNFGELKDFDMTKMDTPGTKEYNAVTRKDINNQAIEMLQPSETSPTIQKRMSLYAKNSKNWSHLLGGIAGEYKIDKGTLRKFYANFAKADEDFQEDIIITGGTDVPVEPGSKTWTDYVGVRDKSATVKDIITQALLKNAEIYSREKGRVLTKDELVKLIQSEGDTQVSGISETLPENVLPFLTGNDNFVQGVNFATGNGVYTVNKVTASDIDARLNQWYREGVLNRNEWLDFPGGYKYQIPKPKKGETKITVNIKNKDGKITPYNSLSEAVENLSQ